MELVTYTDSDLPLTEALECDPAVMKELGGPIAKDAIPETHRRRIDAVAQGGWWFKIVPEASGPAAGTIGIWRSEWRGREIHEAGWMVLPSFQGWGIAGSALDRLLALARSDPRFESVHAFPGVSNTPSNALCRRSGFTMLEECDVEYAGRVLRCIHCELGLSGGGAPSPNSSS